MLLLIFTYFFVNLTSFNEYVFPIIFLIISGSGIVFSMVKIITRSPSIILNKGGICLKNKGVFKWGRITRSSIEIGRSNSSDSTFTDYYLVLEIQKG